MNRLHRKLFRINDQLAELDLEERAVREELDMHRSINEDAQVDAQLGNYIDREEAGLTARDVARFERALSAIRTKRGKLHDTRSRLLAKLETK